MTHRKGKTIYVFHSEDCPNACDCCPTSTMGPFAYIKSEDDRRFYPEIPRNSPRFKTHYNERTTTERLNDLNDDYKLDRRAHNAAYGLIDLTLTNILEHAVVRHLDQVKRAVRAASLAADAGNHCPGVTAHRMGRDRFEKNRFLNRTGGVRPSTRQFLAFFPIKGPSCSCLNRLHHIVTSSCNLDIMIFAFIASFIASQFVCHLSDFKSESSH